MEEVFMKKVLILVSLILVLILLATQVVADAKGSDRYTGKRNRGVPASSPVVADTKVSDIDTVDPLTNINALYWKGNDSNPSGKGQLKNEKWVTEEAWLEALLGKVYDDKEIILMSRVEADSGGLGSDLTQINDYYFKDWDYAVVKYGKYWIAYEDTGRNDYLTTDKLRYGISHITFFDPPPPPTAAPEPTTMLLLGLGLVGLAGVRRKFKK
jgi:hypothetical protein